MVLPDHTHSLFIGQFMRVWYLSHKRYQTGKDQMRLQNCAVSPEALGIALKRKDVDDGSGPILWASSQKLWYLSHMRAVKDQARLHIRTLSPKSLQIILKRRGVDEGSAKFYKPVKESSVLSAHASSEFLKRRDLDEGPGKFYRPVQESLVHVAYASSKYLKKKECS